MTRNVSLSNFLVVKSNRVITGDFSTGFQRMLLDIVAMLHVVELWFFLTNRYRFGELSLVIFLLLHSRKVSEIDFHTQV